MKIQKRAVSCLVDLTVNTQIRREGLQTTVQTLLSTELARNSRMVKLTDSPVKVLVHLRQQSVLSLDPLAGHDWPHQISLLREVKKNPFLVFLLM